MKVEGEALDRRNKWRLVNGWTYAPADESHGFFEREHTPCVWTPPPRKPRQKKVKPIDVQPRMDFDEK